jgi:glycerophosphoryl diester phosphodiesterase
MLKPLPPLLLATALCLTACENDSADEKNAYEWKTLSGKPPIVVAHRGASARMPGHTLAAYELAIEHGADLIEPDLVLTKDDVLVARHDRYLSLTTNIADLPQFADRKTTKDGREDWWMEDFTLAEVRTLRARQHYEHRSKEFDDQFGIPTLVEVIELAKRLSIETGRTIGINPEPKEAEQFFALGKDIGAKLVEVLRECGWAETDSPVIIQSFETAVLMYLNGVIDVPLIQLTLSKTYFDENAAHESYIDVEGIVAYADGVGPSKRLIVHDDGTVTDFIAVAHDLGLEVHVWTLMGDQDSPDGLSPEDETRRLFDLGVDAVFADDPQQAVAVRAERL